MIDNVFPDSSHWSGEIAFDILRTEALALIYKNTQGTYLVDSQAARSHSESLRVVLPYAAYHFQDYSEDAIAQAEFLYNNLGDPKPHVVIIDAETVLAAMLGVKPGSTQQTYRTAEVALRNRAKTVGVNAYASYQVPGRGSQRVKLSALLDAISQVANDTYAWGCWFQGRGFLVVVYTGNGFAEQYLYDDRLSEFDLWISHPGAQTPKIPYPWNQYGSWDNNPRVCAWQYTWKGKLQSFPEGDVDLNKLAAWALPASKYFQNGKEYQPGDPSDPRLPHIVRANYDVPGGKWVNERDAPSMKGNIIGRAPNGLELHVTGANSDATWYECGVGIWLIAEYCERVNE